MKKITLSEQQYKKIVENYIIDNQDMEVLYKLGQGIKICRLNGKTMMLDHNDELVAEVTSRYDDYTRTWDVVFDNKYLNFLQKDGNLLYKGDVKIINWIPTGQWGDFDAFRPVALENKKADWISGVNGKLFMDGNTTFTKTGNVFDFPIAWVQLEDGNFNWFNLKSKELVYKGDGKITRYGNMEAKTGDSFCVLDGIEGRMSLNGIFTPKQRR